MHLRLADLRHLQHLNSTTSASSAFAASTVELELDFTSTYVAIAPSTAGPASAACALRQIYFAIVDCIVAAHFDNRSCAVTD